jgi:hypothetical protein
MNGTSENQSVGSKHKNLKKIRSVIAKYKNKSTDMSNMSSVENKINRTLVSIKGDNRETVTNKLNESVKSEKSE